MNQLCLFDFEQGLHIRQISYNDTKPFLLGIHYARRMPCIQYAFGLFDNEELIGIVTYGQPASPSLCSGIAGEENKHNVLELNRLCFLPNKNGDNHASILVSKSLKMLPHGTYVVSYADYGAWHHIGYVYQATNFLYTGLTKERTDIASVAGHSRHYIKGTTERKTRSAKHRYIYLVGSKRERERERMLKDLRYPVINEYPKGNSKRYDTNNPK